ncbi:MAG: methyltransferase domain-containing protein [Nanoarchaeota archaeon]
MVLDSNVVSAMKTIQSSKNRSKVLTAYQRVLEFSLFFDLPLVDFLDEKTTTEFSWADFGSGNQIALREAKYNLDSRPFRTYAVDMLEIDPEEKIVYDLNKNLFPWSSRKLASYESDRKVLGELFASYYAPVSFTDDIADVVLPEKVDLITAAWVFPYIKNPIPAIDNAYNHLNEGGFFVFNTEFSAISDLRSFVETINNKYSSKIFSKDGELYCCCRK